MKKEKKFFNFKESDYKSKLLDIYPYQATNDLGIVYIEKCKVLALEADYHYRKPIKFHVTLETQTKGTINIFSFGEHLDIVDFFPCPKHFDEVIAVLSERDGKWVTLGIRPISECQYLYDHIVSKGAIDISKELSYNLNPFDFPIDAYGKRVPIFKFAYENKIEWLVNFYISRKQLYQNILKDHGVDFILVAYICENDLWDLFIFMINSNKNAVWYFSSYAEYIVSKLGNNKIAAQFMAKIDKLPGPETASKRK